MNQCSGSFTNFETKISPSRNNFIVLSEITVLFFEIHIVTLVINFHYLYNRLQNDSPVRVST